MAQKQSIETSIKSFEFRLEERKNEAQDAIACGDYQAAQIALVECIGYKAVIEELDYQLECLEVSRWNDQ